MQLINRILETTRGTIDVREAAISDAAQFRELRLHALQNAPTAFSADYQKNADQPMSYWEGRLEKDENGTIFFAESTHALIGMAGIQRGKSIKTQHGAEIGGVYVRPEWRGLHIAGALVECCIEWARARQVDIVKLAVVTVNTSAVHCYERCEFQAYGTEPRAILHDGQYYDEFLMARTLA